jgi:hypothetical protein
VKTEQFLSHRSKQAPSQRPSLRRQANGIGEKYGNGIAQEINPWEAQSARFEFAARKLNLEEGLWKMLSTPAREIIVHFPVTMDNGRIEMFTGFRVQHSIARGPGKGGIRYAPDVTLDEVQGAGQLDDLEVRRWSTFPSAAPRAASSAIPRR